ncbi:hypothetical protein [Actinomadura chokoriensis]
MTQPITPCPSCGAERIRADLAAGYGLAARRLHDDAQELLHLG